MKQKSTSVMGISPYKYKSFNNLSCTLEIQFQLDDDVSYRSCKFTYYLLRYYSLKSAHRVIEVQGYRAMSLSNVFNGIEVWRSCLPFHFKSPSLQQSLPNDVTLMSSSIVAHKDEMRPVLLRGTMTGLMMLLKFCVSVTVPFTLCRVVL